MKDKYSIAQRNRVVEENLCCIDTVLRHHQGWVRQARLEYDDLYQSLAVCLILSVEEYDSSLGPLRPYLYRKLREELRNIPKPYRLEDTGNLKVFIFCEILSFRKSQLLA